MAIATEVTSSQHILRHATALAVTCAMYLALLLPAVAVQIHQAPNHAAVQIQVPATAAAIQVQTAAVANL